MIVVDAFFDCEKDFRMGVLIMNKKNGVFVGIFPAKPEAIAAAEQNCKRDFVSAMAVVRQGMNMSRYEFLAALSSYLHAEARRDGILEDPAC